MATKHGCSCEPVLENSALFVTFVCLVELFSNVAKCLRAAICQSSGQDAHSHILGSLREFIDYPCEASSFLQFIHLVGQPRQVLAFHWQTPLIEAPRLLAPGAAIVFATTWALRRPCGGVRRDVIMSYLVILALNDTVLPAALLFLAPRRLTTHSYHILPELYTGPLIAAFLWLPLNFVLFYSAITVLAVALSCLALSQGVASDPQQLRLLVWQSIVAGVLSVLYAATRARIWAAVTSAASRGRRRHQKALDWDSSLEPQQPAALMGPGGLVDPPADTVAAASAKATHQLGGCPVVAAAAAGLPTGAALPGASGTENCQLLATATSEDSPDRRRQRHDATTALCSLEVTRGNNRQEVDAPACARSCLRPGAQVEGSHGRGSSGGAASVGAGGDGVSAGTGSDRSVCGAQAVWATGWQRLSCDLASCRCGPGCSCGCGCSGARDCCCQSGCSCDGLGASAVAPSSPAPAWTDVQTHTAQRSAVAGSPAAVQSRPSAPVSGPSVPAYEGFWSSRGGYGPPTAAGAPGASARTYAVPALHTGVAAAAPPLASARPPHPCSTNFVRSTAMAAAAARAADRAASVAPLGSLPLSSEPAGVPNGSACPQPPEPLMQAGAGAGAVFEAAISRDAVSCAAGVSPMEHARALIAAAGLCEYQGSMVLRRVVIRLPAPWATGLTPGWSEKLHEELHKRHPDWHLLNTFVLGSTVPGSEIGGSRIGRSGSDRGSNSGGEGSSGGDRGSSSGGSRNGAACDGGSGGGGVADESGRST